MKLNQIDYKKKNIAIWNEVAPRYHKRWASINQGPFVSTSKLIQMLKIRKGDTTTWWARGCRSPSAAWRHHQRLCRLCPETGADR